MSRTLRPAPATVRFVGAAAVPVALVLLFVYPYYLSYHYSGAVAYQYDWVSVAWLLSPVWTVAAAWGIGAVLDGRVRSLTPARAAVAPVLAPLPFAVDTFRPPTSDVVPQPSHVTEWAPPAGPLDVAGRTLASVGFWRLSAAVFLVAGVAWARDEHRWLRATGLVLVLYGGAHGAATTSFVHGAIFRPMVAALPGAALFVVGAVLADAERPEVDAGDDRRPEAPAID